MTAKVHREPAATAREIARRLNEATEIVNSGRAIGLRITPNRHRLALLLAVAGAAVTIDHDTKVIHVNPNPRGNGN